MRSGIPLSIVVLACLLMQGCSGFYATKRASRVDELTTAHMAAAGLRIETRNGSVDVAADETLTEVAITARLTCGALTMDEAERRLAESSISIARGTDRVLHIEPVFSGGPQSGDAANFEIRLPDAEGVSVFTSNGGIEVKGLSGDLHVETSNAPIVVLDQVGPVRAGTSNGRIRVERNQGEIDVVTSNGSIDVVDQAGTARVRTSNGAIMLTMAPDQPGPVHVSTSNGSIDVHVGSAFSGAVRLRTSNARVSVNDHAGRIVRQDLYGSEGTIVLGEDNQSSRILTSNGSIQLIVDG